MKPTVSASHAQITFSVIFRPPFARAPSLRERRNESLLALSFFQFALQIVKLGLDLVDEADVLGLCELH